MSRRYAFIMKFMSKDFILLICLILGFAILFKMYKSKKDYATTGVTSAIKDPEVAGKIDAAPQAAATKLDPSQAEMVPSTSPSAINEATSQQASRSQTVSETSKTQFLKETFLQMDLPSNIPFQNLDLAVADMAGIYSKANGLEMAVVARKGEVTSQQLEAFLKSADTGVPTLDKKGLYFSAPKTMQPAPGSGMKSAQLWSGRGQNNQEVHVAVFTRTDGAGSYMFVVSGAAGTLENRGDDFERIYNSMKAQPGVK